MTDRLLAAGNCYSRAQQLVAINDEQPSPILSPPKLSGLLSQLVEFSFIDDEGGQYRPFTPSYANAWLHNFIERNRLSIIKLFTHNAAC